MQREKDCGVVWLSNCFLFRSLIPTWQLELRLADFALQFFIVVVQSSCLCFLFFSAYIIYIYYIVNTCADVGARVCLKVAFFWLLESELTNCLR